MTGHEDHKWYYYASIKYANKVKCAFLSVKEIIELFAIYIAFRPTVQVLSPRLADRTVVPKVNCRPLVTVHFAQCISVLNGALELQLVLA